MIVSPPPPPLLFIDTIHTVIAKLLDLKWHKSKSIKKFWVGFENILSGEIAQWLQGPQLRDLALG